MSNSTYRTMAVLALLVTCYTESTAIAETPAMPISLKSLQSRLSNRQSKWHDDISDQQKNDSELKAAHKQHTKLETLSKAVTEVESSLKKQEDRERSLSKELTPIAVEVKKLQNRLEALSRRVRNLPRGTPPRKRQSLIDALDDTLKRFLRLDARLHAIQHELDANQKQQGELKSKLATKKCQRDALQSSLGSSLNKLIEDHEKARAAWKSKRFMLEVERNQLQSSIRSYNRRARTIWQRRTKSQNPSTPPPATWLLKFEDTPIK